MAAYQAEGDEPRVRERPSVTASTAMMDCLRLVVEAAPNAMLLVDRHGRIELANRSAEILFGYPRAELVGQRVDLVIDAPGAEAGSPPATTTPPAQAGQERFGRRKDGSEVPIEIGFNAIETPTGPFTLASIIESRLRLFVEGAPNAMLAVDASRRITLINRKAEELFGYTRAELAGQPIEVLVPARFRALHPGLVESFFGAPKARPMGSGRDLYALRRDGSEFPVEIGLNPIVTTDGMLVMTSIIDLSERKATADAAKRIEERFRLMVEGMNDYSILMLDPAGRVASWNAGAERQKGYREQEILGRDFACFYTGEDIAQGRPAADLEVARRQGRFEGEGWRVNKDGSRIWANHVLTAMRDDKGEIYGFSKMTHDLTQKRRAEEHLQLVVEASPAGTVMMSREGRILLVNAQIEKLFGYTRGELLGQPIELLVPVRYRANHPEHRRDFFAAPRARAMGAGRDLFGLRKDGSEFPVEIGLNPIQSDEGPVVMASIIDITQRKSHEDELRRSNAELEQFAYIASHDLQEPLRMVASYTELLGQRYQGKLDAKADKYIGYAVDGAKRMQRLVADLLSYSRVGSQGKPLVPVESAAVVDSVLAMVAPQVSAIRATVRVDRLPRVIGDEVQLRQLFQNLIGNALRFHREVPLEIALSAQRVGNLWQFTVRDNGIGFDMKYADRIFQMFQRLHERGRYEGSGIGLAISKRIVERHGGRIWAQSTPGVGTSFCFTLAPAPAGRAS